MFINVIKTYRNVVAVCDKELLGKVFEEEFNGKIVQLDVKENFYKGKQADEKEVIETLKKMSYEDATFNIVGARSVECAIKAEIISEENVGDIAGIPFSLVLV